MAEENPAICRGRRIAPPLRLEVRVGLIAIVVTFDSYESGNASLDSVDTFGAAAKHAFLGLETDVHLVDGKQFQQENGPTEIAERIEPLSPLALTSSGAVTRREAAARRPSTIRMLRSEGVGELGEQLFAGFGLGEHELDS